VVEVARRSVVAYRHASVQATYDRRMPSRVFTRAVAAIEGAGVLLVYPPANREDPPSLWSVLHPGAEMRWAWDEGADGRVVALWHLREELARSRAVVYTKWWTGRATFFGRDTFRALLARLRAASSGDLTVGLARESRALLEVLQDESPLPTKALRAAAELEGRVNEAAYTRAARPLWARLLTVGAGEVAEGGFPSLAVGATELLFEDLWNAASAPREGDEALLARPLASPALGRALRKIEKELHALTAAR